MGYTLYNMFRDFTKRLPRFDWGLLVGVASLTIIGLSTILSTVLAGQDISTSIFTKQLLAATIGVLAFMLITWVDMAFIVFFAPAVYAVSLLLLIAVLFVGGPIRGANSWFVLGPVQVQPAEIAKIGLILGLARYIDFAGKKMHSWRYLVGALVLIAPCVVLVAIQPDFGSASVLASIALAMLFVSPVGVGKIVLGALGGIAATPAVYYSLADYQQTRILSFLNPGSDPLGAGYNQLQSVIAVGAGKIFGKGWGRGTQSHLQFLPEHHTDFIFATFAEEFGFIGTLMVIGLFVFILVRMYLITQNVQRLFPFLVVVGVMAMLFIQVLFNIGMNIGIMPVAGLPLPFVSYGGSALVISYIAIGLVESIAIDENS